MIFRDLEKVRVIVKEATGLDISYAYEDLVFPDNTVFIIQFDAHKGNKLNCFFQEEAEQEDRLQITEKLIKEAQKNDCQMLYGGLFKLEQENEIVNIHFFN